MDEQFMRDDHECSISSLLDGELHGEEMRRAIDHLVDEGSLRRFWKQARMLQQKLTPGSRAEHLPPSDDMWQRIERQSGLSPARVFTLPHFTPRIWAAAASILLILSVSIIGVWQSPGPATATERVITLGANEGSMSEERFIELTSELLQADPRYHRKMLEVMQVVNQQAYSRSENTGTQETRLAEREDTSPTQQTRPAGRETRNDRTSGPIEFNLW